MGYNGFKLGIALSGGGARGLAHIGVLQALEERKIVPDVISGCSMGAIVGVLYAAGRTPQELKEIFKAETPKKMIKFNFSSPGLLEMNGLRNVLEHYIGSTEFSALKKEFHIAVSNLNTGKSEIINSGNQLYDYVIASSAIPVVFPPNVINGQTYVDGGLFDNLPTEALVGHCHRIIGSHVNPIKIMHEIVGTRAVLERCFQLSIEQNVRVSRGFCDYFIEPREMRKYSLWDYRKGDEIIALGYNSTMKVIDQFILPDLYEEEQEYLLSHRQSASRKKIIPNKINRR